MILMIVIIMSTSNLAYKSGALTMLKPTSLGHSPRLEENPDRYFYYPSTKTYVVGAHWKRLIETLPMSATTYVFIEK